MKENELTQSIIGCCIEVHKTLGPGLLESVYEEALGFELASKHISCKRQVLIPVNYKYHTIDAGFRADLIVDDSVIVEIKSVEKLNPVHSKQLLTYLRLTGKKIGLLVNFNSALLKDGLERIINGY